LVDPKFLLDTPLFGPDRMQREGVEAYWNHWVSLAEAGSPLSFISVGKSKGIGGSRNAGKKDDGDNGDKGEEDIDDEGSNKAPTEPLVFAIDENILLPCECRTPAELTECLQDLAPGKDKTSRTFVKLVKYVDLLEVSLIPVNQPSTKFVLF
jgi:hypothetical protein